MAITYFGRSVVPADGAAATNATSTITITPPGSMTTGDLCVVYLEQRGTATFSVTTTGGQAWSSFTRRTTTNIAVQGFWCRFNGTWGANPVFTFSAATCTSGIMIVYRPTDTGKSWAIDVNETSSTFAAPTTPFTVTRAGLTATQSSTVSLAGWFTADDNTWGSISGTGWVVTGDAQYRNTAGSDMSMAFAHKIQGSGATGSVSLNQSTLGGDAGLTTIVTFYEFTPDTLYPKQIVSNSGTAGTTSLVMGTVTAGARVAVVVTQGNDNVELSADCGISSTPTLTWTKRSDAGATSSGNVEIYDTVHTSGGALTINISWGSITLQATAIEVTGQESSPGGTSATATAQTNPSVSVTTGRNNSLVLLGTSDWNVVNGSTRTYRFSETELYYVLATGNTGYHYFKIVPTAGTNSFGLTAPTMTGGGGGTAAYEIRVSAGATMTASTGTFTLTGNAANLLEAKKIVAATASYTLTGNAANLLEAKRMTASTGSFTLTGQSVNLLRAKLMTASTGSFTLTGNATNLLEGKKIVATTGAYVVTGNAANLGRASTMTASSASFTLTGQNIATRHSYMMPVTNGSYTITGNVTNLTRGRFIALSTGSYTITGNDINLLEGKRMTASTGSYTLIGNNASTTKAFLLSADTGSYTLTGETVLFHQTLIATHGSFTLVGNDSTLTKANLNTLVASTGTFNLTGFDVALSKTNLLTASVGTFVLTGNDSILFKGGRMITCATGAYILTGNDIITDVVILDSGRPTVRVSGWPFKRGYGTTKLK